MQRSTFTFSVHTAELLNTFKDSHQDFHRDFIKIEQGNDGPFGVLTCAYTVFTAVCPLVLTVSQHI